MRYPELTGGYLGVMTEPGLWRAGEEAATARSRRRSPIGVGGVLSCRRLSVRASVHTKEDT